MGAIKSVDAITLVLKLSLSLVHFSSSPFLFVNFRTHQNQMVKQNRDGTVCFLLVADATMKREEKMRQLTENEIKKSLKRYTDMHTHMAGDERKHVPKHNFHKFGNEKKKELTL